MNKANKVSQYLKLNIDKYCYKFNKKNNSNFLKSFEKDKFFLKELNKKVQSNNYFKKRSFKSIYELSIYRNFIYYVIRETKPKKVVETGVLHGLTTAWILKALHDNKKGNLISIDIKRSDWNKYFKKKMGPGSQYDIFPEGEEPGWIIPEYLKNRWKLIYGPSHKYVNKIKNVELFIHDSDHSYENVKNEIEKILKNNKNIPTIIDNFDMNRYAFEHLAKHSPKNGYCNKSFMFIDEVRDDLNVFESAIIIK
jgi:hypothetical protein